MSVAGGDIVLRVSNIPGLFKMPALSDLARRIIFEGHYEPEVTKALAGLPVSRSGVVNVGANVGLIAAYFASLPGQRNRVVAIEPNPEAYDYLVQNIETNHLRDKITAVNACIGKNKGFVEFAYISGKPEYSSVGGIVHPAAVGQTVTKIQVPLLMLDEVVENAAEIGLIFVDVEGAEEQVFRGAESILINHHPVLFFECSDLLLRKFGDSSQGLDSFLSSLGYVVRNAFAPHIPVKHPFEGELLAEYKH